MQDVAYLISRSCTTGWLDWIHGELWLLPTALIRRGLGLAATRANGLGRTVPDPLPQLPANVFDRHAIRAERRTNKVIAFDDVDRAALFQGRAWHGLNLVTKDDHSHKLWWLKEDPAYFVLVEALAAKLGSRLTRG